MLSRLTVLSALLAATVAFAQDAPNGIKIGAGRMHPFLDLEGRYDSAVGYFGQATPEGDIVFRFRPGLRFELLGTDNVIHFNGQAEYVLNSGLISPSARQASHFETDIGIDAAFNKTGAVEFQIGDHLVRSDRTGNAVVTTGALSLYNNARLAVPIHPGGGALEFTPKADWAVEFFEPLVPGLAAGCTAGDPLCDPAILSSMNYSNLSLGLGARWRFLPKTAVVFDGGVGIRSYWSGANTPATLMKLQAGLAGLISSKISLLILAGYGRDFVSATPASTFIGQAEIGILLSELITFKFGYVRTLQPVPVYGVFGDDRGYAEAKTTFGRFSLIASAAFDFLSFYGTPSRNDSVITFSVTPSFQVVSWFSIGAGYNMSTRISTSTVVGARFTRHEAILRLHFSY